MSKRGLVWTWVALAGIVGARALRSIAGRLTSLFPPCPVQRWFGWDCPGCGGTRCAQRLLAGDIGGAMAMNPMVVLCAGLLGAWLVYAIVTEWRGARMTAPPSWTVWSLFGLTVVFAATRNLPWWPFTLLAPP